MRPGPITQLVITPSYVPIDSSVTLINAKIIEKLEKLDVHSVVLTVAEKDTSYVVTPQLSDYFYSDRKVYRIRSYEIGGKGVLFFRKLLREIIPPLFYVPDYHFIWELLAIRKLSEIARYNSIDIIHSISAPYCSHIVGLFAKMILKKPWICHLDDFWVDQISEHFDRYRFINEWLEGRCFQKADVVLSTSREILDFARLRYSSEICSKFVFIPPGYDPGHYPKEKDFGSGKFQFTYLGRFYPGKRDPVNVFKALAMLKNEKPEVYDRIAFDFIGDGVISYQGMADEMCLGDVVTCRQQVDYMESMKRMRQASVLVHLGFMNRKYKHDIHVSGKIFEYFGAERLIFGITTLKGPVAEIIKKYHGVVCDYNDPEDIAKSLERIVSSYTPEGLRNWKNPEEITGQFSVGAVAGEYKTMIESLL
jgi:glycosyltransferase involved in cell wall biosynthesis